MDDVRTALVDLLTDVLGGTVDTADSHLDDGWLTAHVALRAVEWVLDAAGPGQDRTRHPDLWRRLQLDGAVTALAKAHQRYEFASYSNDDLEWPLPVRSYVALIERVLGVDLASLPVEGPLLAPVRFGAPDDEDLARAIGAQTDFNGRFDPASWLIQRRIGHALREPDPTSELDRFVAHWSYRRSYPNPWVEVGRNEAVEHIVAVQRTSLVRSQRPRWDPGADVARNRAARFLSCFTDDTRFFTNGHGYRSDNLQDGNYFTINPKAWSDTGIVMISPRIAGIWWHAEGDPETPSGMSP